MSDNSGGLEISDEEAATLTRIFEKYCLYGALSKPKVLELTLCKFSRLLLDSGILQVLGKHQIESTFSSCVASERTMKFENFLEALGVISHGIFPDEQVFEKAVARLLREHIFVLDCLEQKSIVNSLTEGNPTRVEECNTSVKSKSKAASRTSSYSSGTLNTVNSRHFPVKQEKPQSVRLGEETVTVFKRIYDGYAVHWCSGCVVRTTRKNKGAGGQTPRSSGKFTWVTEMCYGGFQSFVADYQIADNNDPIVSKAFHSSFPVEHDESFDLEKPSSISFTQFLSAVTCLAASQFKSRHGVVKFAPAVSKLIKQCLCLYTSSAETWCNNGPATTICSCTNPLRPIQVDPALLPLECQADKEVRELLQNSSVALRGIFCHYYRCEQQHRSLPYCRGGRCRGPSPLICQKGFLRFANDFEIHPRFMRESQLISLFNAGQSDSTLSTAASQVFLSFPQFIGVLAHCALAGLSRYPYANIVTTAVERIDLFLKKLQVSKGMAKVFGHRIPVLCSLEQISSKPSPSQHDKDKQCVSQDKEPQIPVDQSGKRPPPPLTSPPPLPLRKIANHAPNRGVSKSRDESKQNYLRALKSALKPRKHMEPQNEWVGKKQPHKPRVRTKTRPVLSLFKDPPSVHRKHKSRSRRSSSSTSRTLDEEERRHLQLEEELLEDLEEEAKCDSKSRNQEREMSKIRMLSLEEKINVALNT